MPDFLPDRLEAGTHNMPGIAGLLEGLRWVERQGVNKIAAHERKLMERLARGLNELSELRVFWSDEAGVQTGVLSFRMENRDCEMVGEALAEAGFALRPGLHCAPLAHRSAGTLETGTVRASLSAFNRMCEIDQFLCAVKKLPVLR